MEKDRIWAALMFFTRLPLWRIKTVDAGHFKYVVNYWPLAGWLTGGIMALVCWGAAFLWPPLVAVWMAVAARWLLTGGLHEDGLADCADGLGGGGTRERILAIMKDSHIGTYGVLALIVYTGLLTVSLASLPMRVLPLVVLCGDVWSKACSSFIILQLPYARNAEQAKARVVYERWSGRAVMSHVLRCLLITAPAVVLLGCFAGADWLWILLVPPVVEMLAAAFLRHRLGGYTGDCCGAMFLVCELGFYLAAAMMVPLVD